MIVKSFSGVRVGDFVRAHGAQHNPNWTQVWWKVTAVAPDKITMVNRGGRERHLTWQQAKDTGLTKFKTWQLGDPREDGDNL